MVPKIDSMMDHQDHTWTLNIKDSKTFLISQEQRNSESNVRAQIPPTHSKPTSQEQYIGETEKTLAIRFSQHRGYARNRETQKATGEHFNKTGHKISDMKITILEKLVSKDPQLRKIRESYCIQKFNTRYKGMNKKS